MSAFAIPIIPEKLAAWKNMIAECAGSRLQEFEDFNDRMDLTDHRVWLAHSPQGPLAIILHEGPGHKAILGKLATSDHPFDTWFRNCVSEFHGFDFNQQPPGPLSEQLLDWHAEVLDRVL